MSLFRHFVETEFYFRLNFLCLFFNLSRKRYFWFPHVLYISFFPSLCNMHEFLGKCQMHWFFPLGAHHYLLNDCLPGSWWEYFPPVLKGGEKKILPKSHWKWWEYFKILCLCIQTKDTDLPPRLQPINETSTFMLWITYEVVKSFCCTNRIFLQITLKCIPPDPTGLVRRILFFFMMWPCSNVHKCVSIIV